MNIKNVNKELGIVSCSREQVLGEPHEASAPIFFYYPKRDWIIFNEDHPNYDLFFKIVHGYMELDDWRRKEFLSQVDVETSREPFAALNLILRIRRKLYRSREARRAKQNILGYPVTGQVALKNGSSLPLVDIPQMTDEKWQQLAKKNAIRNYTKKHGYPPESTEVATTWQRKWVDEIMKA